MVGNAIFLFLYSTRTKDKRKTGSLFTLRHTCQDLLGAVLTPAETRLLTKSLPDRDAPFFFDYTTYPLARRAAQERQNVEEVGLLPFENDERQAVYIEFRMLGWVLQKVLRKETLTLNDLAKLKRARRLKLK